MRERNALESAIETVNNAETELADTVELTEMAEAEGDEDMIEEATAGVSAQPGCIACTVSEGSRFASSSVNTTCARLVRE